MAGTDEATSRAALTADRQRETGLKAALREPPSLAVAFSGGVDSAYLLSVAFEVRGPARVRAVLGVSPSLSRNQHEQARRVAAWIGVPLEEVTTAELGNARYRANLGDRCFHCKDVLFATIRSILSGELLVDGTNGDDVMGHRPGMRAAQVHLVRSPLLEAGLGKEAIRHLSRQRGLPTADLPASPCLASRFPAGVPVSRTDLARVEAAEEVLRLEGLREFRVRHHGDLARIEVPLQDLPLLCATALGGRVARALHGLGYRFVTVDLLGFRSGSGSELPMEADP